MAKTGLFQAVCTAAIFTAGAAFAQTNMPTGDTAAGGAPNNPTAHETMPKGTMAPADKMGMRMEHHSRGMGMSHSMRGRTDPSKQMGSDQLNDQSYRAARSGQAFAMPSSTDSGGMATPGGAMGKGQTGGDGNGNGNGM